MRSLRTLLMLGLATITVGFASWIYYTHHSLKPNPSTNLEAQLLKACTSPDCLSAQLKTITYSNGPLAALDVLSKLQADGHTNMILDDHQRAHEVGRFTAQSKGASGDAFLACGTSFNYGCQHGFFEEVLNKSGTSKLAAEKICGQFEQDPKYSSKFKFYCYHGVGHGVMMAEAYDLMRSLNDCDSFPTSIGQDGCWQGVFMEDVNAFNRSEPGKLMFSSTDLLAPCNIVAAKYRHECYINLAGRLMVGTSNNVSSATQACLGAGEWINTCLESVALMLTNPSWQPQLAPGASGSLEQIAWQLCGQFPADHVSTCVNGSVDNLLNFDEMNVSRSNNFCSAVSIDLKTNCYRRIGSGLRSQSVDLSQIKQSCNNVDADFRKVCKEAAGVS